MVIVMGTEAAQADIQRVLDRLGEHDCAGELTVGVERTIITVVGPTSPALQEDVRVLPHVDNVVLLAKSYDLAGRGAHPDGTIVMLGNTPVGGDGIAVIAGPSAVESADQIDAVAAALREMGASALSGSALRVGNSPYAFSGLGKDGLRLLAHAGAANGLPVVSEVPTAADVDLVARYVDVLEIAPANMRNIGLLEAAARTGKAIVLHRELSGTLDEWLLSAEHILYAGNPHVILCESGIRTYEPATRTTTDISAVPTLRGLTHLPVIVDASRSAGQAVLVGPLALAAVAAGAHGLRVDVHPNPDRALLDGPQALRPEECLEMLDRVRGLAAALGQTLGPAEAPARGG